MKARMLMTLALVLICAISLNAQIANSKHDLSSGSSAAIKGTSSELCIYCHTPHTTSTADQLWNKGAVDVVTHNTTNTGTAQASNNIGTTACLSCHDGATSMGTVLNEIGSGASGTDYTVSGTGVTAGVLDAGITALGTDVSSDHPVGMSYAAVKTADDAGFNLETSVESALGITDMTTVECGTCHDPHNTSNGLFLRISNSTASALCTTCHNK